MWKCDLDSRRATFRGLSHDEIMGAAQFVLCVWSEPDELIRYGAPGKIHSSRLIATEKAVEMGLIFERLIEEVFSIHRPKNALRLWHFVITQT